jgi:hypothetical protein
MENQKEKSKKKIKTQKKNSNYTLNGAKIIFVCSNGMENG